MFTLIKENHVNAVIPDHSTLTNSINVWREGIVQDLKVHLNIAHPFVGDLSVRLTSPSGIEVTLHNREGGSSDNLAGTIQGEVVAGFIGEQAKGLWTLHVSDHATRDSGTLVDWSIEMVCEEFHHYSREIFIPEVAADLTLVSTQECRFNGRVIEAEADLEIEHPLIGDLVATLTSPSGTEVTLHNREGGSQHHVVRHFDGNHLRAMAGSQTQGEWVLRVKNFHAADNGVLKYWKVKFRYETVDDLKVVEGIGPKIEQLFNGAGIYTFAGLAGTSAGRMKEILVAGGDRFKNHDPRTWGQQGAMAAQGKWEELKAWQEQLSGGKVAA